jgi:para-nitrobenzyl esterase
MAVQTMTQQGAVEGRDKDGICLFAAIPYAAPPTGDRRFRPPQPHEGWSGVRAADRFGPAAWQDVDRFGGVGKTGVCDEDCLHLNVQTPATDDGGRPVMVWIHGGAFVSGAGAMPSYDGSRFVDHGDVVVVTINYRLGALGFLHLAEIGGEPYVSSGLNGILDQVAALEWVRDNIAAFGGDPGNVTIFGESAGAMSIGTLLGLPRARGLFHQAIAESGATANIATPARAAEVTGIFLDQLGARDLDGLMAASPTDLIAAQMTVALVLAEQRRAGDGPDALTLDLPYQPVLDGVELPQQPLDAIRDGLSADVALIVGSNLEEWNLFQLLNPDQVDDDTVTRRLGRVFPNGEEIAALYRKARPNASPQALWSAIITDIVFRLPAIRLAEAQSTHQPDATFAYLFTWRSRAFDGRLGSAHSLEIPFVFDNLDRQPAPLFIGEGPTPTDLAAAMHESWWRFARTRSPQHDGIPTWTPYDTERRSTIEFNDTIRLLSDPFPAEREVWRDTGELFSARERSVAPS